MARKLKGVPYYFYPCRCLSVDQARLLFSRPLGNHKIAVQYLGWNWSGASTNEAIAKSTFLPLGGTTHDDTLLHAFLDQQFGTSPDTAVERRTEELVIRASWQRVREKQATKDKARLEVDTPHSTAPVLHSRDKMNAGYDSSGSGDDGHIRDETAEYEGLTKSELFCDRATQYDTMTQLAWRAITNGSEKLKLLGSIQRISIFLLICSMVNICIGIIPS